MWAKTRKKTKTEFQLVTDSSKQSNITCANESEVPQK